MAIVQYKQNCQRANIPGYCGIAGVFEATSTSSVPKTELGSIQEEIERLLTGLGCQQLQQLLENISEKLNIRGPPTSDCHSVQASIQRI